MYNFTHSIFFQMTRKNTMTEGGGSEKDSWFTKIGSPPPKSSFKKVKPMTQT